MTLQPKEQRVILLESPPDQEEYQVTQPKRKTTSKSSSSRLSKGPVGGTEPQAIAGSATTSMAPSEQQDPVTPPRECIRDSAQGIKQVNTQ